MLDQAHKLRQMADQNDSSLQDKPKIITVTSGKGGVGKSNFVVNLAISLQKMGKKVLIFDADVGTGNDDVLMGVLPKYNVFDVIYDNKEIEDVVIIGPYGVKLLPGGSGLSRMGEMNSNQRNIFIEKLNALRGLDFIIMDTGAGINRDVLGFIACCEDLVVITTPEPTSLIDSYGLLKAVDFFKLQSSAKIVINRVLDNEEAQDTYNKFSNAVERFLKIKVGYLGSISDDKRLIQAVRNQKPLIINYPNCHAAKDIINISQKILGEPIKEKGTGIQGLFKKMFSIFS